MNSRRLILSAVFGLSALGWGHTASAQYVVQTPTYRYYQPAQPRYVQRTAPFAARRSSGYYSSPLPYNRSPYTDGLEHRPPPAIPQALDAADP